MTDSYRDNHFPPNAPSVPNYPPTQPGRWAPGQQPHVSLVGALFNLRFDHLVTTRIVPALYGLFIALSGLVAFLHLITGVVVGIRMMSADGAEVVGAFFVLLVLLIVPVAWIVSLMFVRLVCEFFVATAKIAENTSRIRGPFS